MPPPNLRGTLLEQWSLSIVSLLPFDESDWKRWMKSRNVSRSCSAHCRPNFGPQCRLRSIFHNWFASNRYASIAEFARCAKASFDESTLKTDDLTMIVS